MPTVKGDMSVLAQALYKALLSLRSYGSTPLTKVHLLAVVVDINSDRRRAECRCLNQIGHDPICCELAHNRLGIRCGDVRALWLVAGVFPGCRNRKSDGRDRQSRNERGEMHVDNECGESESRLERACYAEFLPLMCNGAREGKNKKRRLVLIYLTYLIHSGHTSHMVQYWQFRRAQALSPEPRLQPVRLGQCET